jgi:hypothetical protein
MKQIRICVKFQAKVEEDKKYESRREQNCPLELVFVHLAVGDSLS